MVNEIQLSSDASRAINLARDEAILLKDHYVGTEHLLLALLFVKYEYLHAQIIKKDITIDDLRKGLLLVKSGSKKYNKTATELPLSPRVSRLMTLAAQCAVQCDRTEISLDHIFISLLYQTNGRAISLLEQLDLNIREMKTQVANTLNVEIEFIV